MSNATKATTLAQLQSLISGLEKQFPTGNFTIGNAAFTTASLAQLFQGWANAIAAVNAAQAQAEVAVAAMNASKAQAAPVALELKRQLQSMFGTATDKLAMFGLEPRKAPAPLTAEQKTAAAAKRTATRQARGTTSKKKKLAVRGNVTGVVVTPITTPSAPASPAAPAPAAASTTGK